MEGGMNNKICPCHIHDDSNSMLSMCILVLGADAGEGLTLPFLAVAPKHLLRENTIIIMIVLYFADSLVVKPLFETSLTHNCFISTKRNWVLNPFEHWCCIIKDVSTALKMAILWFTSIPGRQTSGRLTDELVCRDEITLVVLISRESSITIVQ